MNNLLSLISRDIPSFGPGFLGLIIASVQVVVIGPKGPSGFAFVPGNCFSLDLKWLVLTEMIPYPEIRGLMIY
ncbi:hypothetical protein CEXT_815951 [Caerostris extrusa]|uniref:Uncharacterized protein n=1 Tax=Caerostris extrusa TaxID=172846 RepID=A0AAV4W686_CAEEX|nr:hypothetical protein CEXT_815951 [Caerostris extrusa]